MIELISSCGGPLILVEESLLPFWGGIENIGGLASEERGCSEAGRPCDYNRAGEVKGWIGAIQVGNGFGVVFWGDDLSLGLQQTNSSSLLVVRPWCGEAELDKEVSVLMAHSARFEAGPTFHLASGHLVVFDSAHPGFDVVPPVLRATLEPGSYVASTHVLARGDASGITLHRLERCGA